MEKQQRPMLEKRINKEYDRIKTEIETGKTIEKIKKIRVCL
jgi:hypothetical protein